MNALLPLLMFAFVTSITPGPNNIMLTSSGIAFGFARTLPHMLGVTFGMGVLLALCGAGIGALVLALPSAQLLLKVFSSAYLLYLAWQLRLMAFEQKAGDKARPMSFRAAALFQFVNPKAWVMAVTGASAFLPALQPVSLAIGLFCLAFCAVNLPCIGLWAGTGAVLRRFLVQRHWQRLFCGAMMALTAYSALAVWL